MNKRNRYVQALKLSHGQHLFSKSCLKFTILLKSNIINTTHCASKLKVENLDDIFCTSLTKFVSSMIHVLKAKLFLCSHAFCES